MGRSRITNLDIKSPTYVELLVFGPVDDVASGNGAGYFHVPSGLDGMDLVEVHAQVIASGTTNSLILQLHNLTQGVDILSTRLYIDSLEYGSQNATTQAVINPSYSVISWHDIVRVDIDQVPSTAPQGLLVTMGFNH